MRRWILLLLLSLSMVPSAFAAPSIVVETLNHDFGEVLQGEKVEYSYRFRNAGDNILEIGNVRSSCGCTAALLSARRIAPGDSGELKATFDSSRFRGGVNKLITMHTNDPDHQEVVFSLFGNVKRELVLEPERVNWGLVKAGAPLNATVTISNQSKSTITLQPPQVTRNGVSAELDSLQLSPGGKVALKLSTKVDAAQARTSGYVIIGTDYPKVPQLRVSFVARVNK